MTPIEGYQFLVWALALAFITMFFIGQRTDAELDKRTQQLADARAALDSWRERAEGPTRHNAQLRGELAKRATMTTRRAVAVHEAAR